MAEKINVIIIDTDENSRRFIKEQLKNLQQIKVTAEGMDFSKAYDLVKKNKPTVLILDLYPNIDHALKVAEKITHSFPQITLFVTSTDARPEIIIQAMRSGAREFLSKPIDKDEFTQAVQNVIRMQHRKMAGEDSGGKIITIFGMKGGVGATTIATNTAVTLAKHTNKSVILLDLNLQLGNAALFLNVQTKYSIVDIANNLEELDPQLLKEVLPKHSSGVHVLTGPLRIEEAESVTGNQFDQILSILKTNFDYVIIDGNKVIDELTLKAFDESESILMVLTVDLPAIYNARRCLEVFQRMGYEKKKVSLIVNRYNASNATELEELEKSIKYSVFWKIPNQDYATVISSVNQGIPISSMTPRSKMSQSFRGLAEHFNGSADAPANNQKQQNNRSLIKKFLSKKSAG